jgi:alkyl sulfatase BDS1-like metallo-beta-lactamase superfamily hydrolase
MSILRVAEDVWSGRADLGSVVQNQVHEAEEVADGILMVPAFAHVFAVRHDDGLLLFDTSAKMFAEHVHRAVRAWSDAPVTHAVFSHGHVDHVFGLGPFDAEADAAGRPRPTVVAHQLVPVRFARYRRTQGYNTVINRRQFQVPDLVFDTDFREPDVTYAERYVLEVGGRRVELTHHRGETDDHTVGWLPEERVLFPGDLFMGVAPNCGNPQKVQRFPVEWAQALRWMAGLGAEVLLGAHGLPMTGRERIADALTDTAAYLESLVEQTLACLNDGLTLDATLQRVRAPQDLLAKPYLQPIYDEPEFVVHAVWHRFGGWYDGNPARLKPAADADLAAELAALAGGAGALARRAGELVDAGALRLAGHLAQLAVDADPDDVVAHRARHRVFAARAAEERSTMARGVFAWAAAESARVSGDEPVAGGPR